MRRVFLWAARNRWLKERLPRLRFMKRAVRRFMPGETLEDALAAALPLQAAGIGTMYTRLGENLENLAEADAVAAHYIEAVDKIVAAGITGEISVKPTQLGLDHDADACLAHLVRIAEHAAGAGSYLWIDMEGSDYVEATVALYEQLRADHARTGICLQAYLKRTPSDVERLRPLDPAIRLVKGAYDEPASIAYRDKRQVDASYLAIAVDILKTGRGRAV
ncbi:MAG: proline dehydrogenase family protein, partial [Chloroflexota bacterium]